MRLLFIAFILTCSGFSFAITLEQVTGELMNVHGASWNSLVSSESEWGELRKIHEKIIDNPEVLDSIYSDQRVVNYIYPNVVHSYGKLIGEGKIVLDDIAKATLLNSLEQMRSKENSVYDSILESIAITNSPWGIKELRKLINDESFDEALVYKKISETLDRFESKENNKNYDIDSTYKVSKVDYLLKRKEWEDEIFELRKLISKNARKHPHLRQLSASVSNKINILIKKYELYDRKNKNSKIHIEKKLLPKKSTHINIKRVVKKKNALKRSSYRSIASGSKESSSNTKAYLIGLLLFLFGCYFAWKFKNR